MPSLVMEYTSETPESTPLGRNTLLRLDLTERRADIQHSREG